MQFDDFYCEALLGEDWVRLNDVRQGSERGSWGILSIDPLERIGNIGKLEFALRADDGNQWGNRNAYTPGHPDCIEGWGIGTLVRFVWWFEGWHKAAAARIRPGGITIDPDPWGQQDVHVKATDFIEDLTEANLPPMEYMTNLRSDEVAEIILSTMARQPLAVELQEGSRVWPSSFDTLREGDGALGELAKVVISEQGYLYTKRDRMLGETLVFEANDARYGRSGPDDLPVAKSESEYLGDELGNYLATADGHPLLLNQVQAGDLGAGAVPQSPKIEYGKFIINSARAVTYPRRVLQAETIFSLGSAVEIRPGAPLELRVRYVDPTGGGAQVSAQTASLQTTLAANTMRDGSGSDISSGLSYTVEAGTSESIYRITTSTAGWLTVLDIEGDAVMIYNAIETPWRDEASVEQYGLQQQDIPMHYAEENDAFLAAAITVADNAVPKLRYSKWRVLAQGAPLNILAWIFLDVGNRAGLAHPNTSHSDIYYIQGVEFEMRPGGILDYTLTTIPADTTLYWILDESELDVSTALSPMRMEL